MRGKTDRGGAFLGGADPAPSNEAALFPGAADHSAAALAGNVPREKEGVKWAKCLREEKNLRKSAQPEKGCRNDKNPKDTL